MFYIAYRSFETFANDPDRLYIWSKKDAISKMKTLIDANSNSR